MAKFFVVSLAFGACHFPMANAEGAPPSSPAGSENPPSTSPAVTENPSRLNCARRFASFAGTRMLSVVERVKDWTGIGRDPSELCLFEGRLDTKWKRELHNLSVDGVIAKWAEVGHTKAAQDLARPFRRAREAEYSPTAMSEVYERFNIAMEKAIRIRSRRFPGEVSQKKMLEEWERQKPGANSIIYMEGLKNSEQSYEQLVEAIHRQVSVPEPGFFHGVVTEGKKLAKAIRTPESWVKGTKTAIVVLVLGTTISLSQDNLKAAYKRLRGEKDPTVVLEAKLTKTREEQNLKALTDTIRTLNIDPSRLMDGAWPQMLESFAKYRRELRDVNASQKKPAPTPAAADLQPMIAFSQTVKDDYSRFVTISKEMDNITGRMGEIDAGRYMAMAAQAEKTKIPLSIEDNAKVTEVKKLQAALDVLQKKQEIMRTAVTNGLALNLTFEAIAPEFGRGQGLNSRSPEFWKMVSNIDVDNFNSQLRLYLETRVVPSTSAEEYVKSAEMAINQKTIETTIYANGGVPSP